MYTFDIPMACKLNESVHETLASTTSSPRSSKASRTQTNIPGSFLPDIIFIMNPFSRVSTVTYHQYKPQNQLKLLNVLCIKNSKDICLYTIGSVGSQKYCSDVVSLLIFSTLCSRFLIYFDASSKIDVSLS